MRKPKGVKCHECAPAGFRGVPNITGDYDMDRTILKTPARGLSRKLQTHLATPRGSYGSRTAYSGYSGTHGDE